MATMEDTRLVFISIKDKVPKRKVAIALKKGMTMDIFLQAVKDKLRAKQIGNLRSVPTGEYISDLSRVQDVEELSVEELKEELPISQAVATEGEYEQDANNQGKIDSTSYMEGSNNQKEQGQRKISQGIENNTYSQQMQQLPTQNKAQQHQQQQQQQQQHQQTQIDYDEQKYTKRSQSTFKKDFSSYIPDIFKPGLPVTRVNDTPQGDKSKRKSTYKFIKRFALLGLALIITSITMVIIFQITQKGHTFKRQKNH